MQLKEPFTMTSSDELVIGNRFVVDTFHASRFTISYLESLILNMKCCRKIFVGILSIIYIFIYIEQYFESYLNY